VLALSGGASRTVLCRAFCCEASGSGPRAGEGYRAGHQSPPKLTAVAEAVARGEYPDDEVQHAVWVLSDGYSIASMGALDSTATDSLRLAVSRLSGQPAPLYSLRFADEPGHRLSFDLTVLGWPPGTYAIHAWSPDRAGVHRMPFTL
jgi:hypothetical protein